MRATKLEKKLLLHLAGTILKWVFCLAAIGLTSYTLRLGATVIVVAWLWFTSFGCCENGYVPKYHYLLRYRFSHSREERLELSRQYESYAYVKIGECVFLEDFLIFTRFGVILPYAEIQNIYYQKVFNLNAVYVCLKNGKKYAFNISEAEYKGESALYIKALEHYGKKKTADAGES